MLNAALYYLPPLHRAVPLDKGRAGSKGPMCYQTGKGTTIGTLGRYVLSIGVNIEGRKTCGLFIITHFLLGLLARLCIAGSAERENGRHVQHRDLPATTYDGNRHIIRDQTCELAYKGRGQSRQWVT